MNNFSRRGLFSFFSGLGGAVLIGRNVSAADAVSIVATAPVKAAVQTTAVQTVGGARYAAMCKALEREVSQDAFEAWFVGMQFERYVGTTLTVSVAVKFLKRWVEAHYSDELLRSARVAYHSIDRIDILVRPPPAPIRTVSAE